MTREFALKRKWKLSKLQIKLDVGRGSSFGGIRHSRFSQKFIRTIVLSQTYDMWPEFETQAKITQTFDMWPEFETLVVLAPFPRAHLRQE